MSIQSILNQTQTKLALNATTGSTFGNSSSNATWPDTFLMRFSGMLSLVEMCSEVTSLQETESWMWDRMCVVPSHVEQFTLPLA